MKQHPALILLTAAILLSGCSEMKADGQKTGSGQPALTSTKAEKRDIVGYALFPGKLDLPVTAQAVVYPPYQTPVIKVDAKVGDLVERGQTLIELDIPDAKAALAQAQANLRAAQTAYSTAAAENGAGVRDAKRALDEARATERTLRDNVQDGDATQLEEAVKARQAAEEVLIQVQASFKQSMLPYQQQIDAANMSMADARSGARQALVKAPIAGTVVKLEAAPGQLIGNDSRAVIAQIVDYSAMTVRATIDQGQRNLVEKGTAVVFATADRSKPPIDGVVRSTRDIPDASGTGVVEVTIDFKNSKVQVPPGTVLRWVGIKTGEAPGVIAVPVEAVQKDSSGKPIVMVLEGSDWKPHVVETGLSDGDWIEIKSGVNVADTVQLKTP